MIIQLEIGSIIFEIISIIGLLYLIQILNINSNMIILKNMTKLIIMISIVVYNLFINLYILGIKNKLKETENYGMDFRLLNLTTRLYLWGCSQIGLIVFLILLYEKKISRVVSDIILIVTEYEFNLNFTIMLKIMSILYIIIILIIMINPKKFYESRYMLLGLITIFFLIILGIEIIVINAMAERAYIASEYMKITPYFKIKLHYTVEFKFIYYKLIHELFKEYIEFLNKITYGLIIDESKYKIHLLYLINQLEVKNINLLTLEEIEKLANQELLDFLPNIKKDMTATNGNFGGLSILSLLFSFFVYNRSSIIEVV